MTDDTAAAPIGSATETAASARVVPIAIIGLLFFVFGFVTWLNGSLIPFLTIICDLDFTEAFLVTFAFYIAYTVMALPMAWVLKRTGYRNGMAVGLAIMSVGALIHIPAAYTASFPLFLVGLFTLGTGLTILQTASNPYIVLLGPAESAARRISIMGIVNKAAGVVVPMVFASLVLSRLNNVALLAEQNHTAETKRMLAGLLVGPYLAMAITLLVLVALIRFAPLPEVKPVQEDTSGDELSLRERPYFVLGVVALFAYIGVEVIAGDTIGLFGSHLGVANFLSLTSYTMAFMILGYIAGIVFIPRVISQQTALMLCGVGGVLMTCGAIYSNPASRAVSLALWGWTPIPTIPDPIFFVAAMGLANALVWPTIWPLALKGLGDATPRASAILIMAISGGALIPFGFGRLSAWLGNPQPAYVVALPCYLLVLLYGWKGCTWTRWNRAAA